VRSRLSGGLTHISEQNSKMFFKNSKMFFKVAELRDLMEIPAAIPTTNSKMMPIPGEEDAMDKYAKWKHEREVQRQKQRLREKRRRAEAGEFGGKIELLFEILFPKKSSFSSKFSSEYEGLLLGI
jgi:hypothetical protein